ncbi:SET domain-containing protein [Striga hermonthica]|uniref:SET domain-containing protein n=1 Tax=Striga hermonthica TaxID=68872 RepID=A0A9N7N3K0_STRHE|nr:SET domain-containing protein [Striga hermonthica]
MTTDLEEAKLELFLQWLQVNGAQLRGSKIKYCSHSKRFGIFKSKDVPDGVLLVVPLHLAITPMRVLEDPLFGPECRSMFEEGEVDDRFLIMLFLTVERLRKNSSWKPYLDMLPNEFGNPLWFTDDELSELKGTTLHKATELQKKNLRSLFDEKVKKLAEKLLAHDGNSDSEVRFEDFLWANSIFWTRALTIPLPRSFVFPRAQLEDEKAPKINESANQVTEVGPASQEGETLWVEGLVPGIDFCNHDLKAAATWEVDGNGSTTGVPYSMYLLSAGDLQAGKEISISYGNKGNEELLYLYGFVIENNPDDYLMIHYPMEAIPDLPFSETKVQLLEAQKGELRCLLPRKLLDNGFFPECSSLEGTYNKRTNNASSFNYSWSGQRKMPSYINKLVFPEDFLTSLRTITMKEKELNRVSSLLEELVGSEKERQPSETEVRTAVWEACGDSGALQMLVDLLNMKMMELEEGSGTEENDAELLEKAHIRETSNEERSFENKSECRYMSRNKWTSIVYRLGQKQLVRRFVGEAEQALQLALSEDS